MDTRPPLPPYLSCIYVSLWLPVSNLDHKITHHTPIIPPVVKIFFYWFFVFGTCLIKWSHIRPLSAVSIRLSPVAILWAQLTALEHLLVLYLPRISGISGVAAHLTHLHLSRIRRVRPRRRATRIVSYGRVAPGWHLVPGISRRGR